MSRQEQFLLATFPGNIDDTVVLARLEDLSTEEVGWVRDAVEHEVPEHVYAEVWTESSAEAQKNPGRYLSLCRQARQMEETLAGKTRDELERDQCYRLAVAAFEFADEVRKRRGKSARPENAEPIALWIDAQDVFHAIEALRTAVLEMTEEDSPSDEGIGARRANVHKSLTELDRLLREPRFHGPLTCWGKRNETWDVLGAPEDVELARFSQSLHEIRDAAERLLVEMVHCRAERDVRFWSNQSRAWRALLVQFQADIAAIEQTPEVRAELLARARESSSPTSTGEPEHAEHAGQSVEGRESTGASGRWLAGERWYLFYRDSASKHLGDEADSGCAVAREWEVFSCLDNLMASEVPVLVEALEAEFVGPVVDDHSIVGNLYEFDAQSEDALRQDPVRYIRARQRWQNLERRYSGQGGGYFDCELHARFDVAARELAEQIRAVRGKLGPPRPTPASGDSQEPPVVRADTGASCTDAADSSTDTTEKPLPRLPESVDVRDLCRLLQREIPKGRSQNEIAREFTGEMPDDYPKAKNLLRQARRYRHLWDLKAQ